MKVLSNCFLGMVTARWLHAWRYTDFKKSFCILCCSCAGNLFLSPDSTPVVWVNFNFVFIVTSSSIGVLLIMLFVSANILLLKWLYCLTWSSTVSISPHQIAPRASRGVYCGFCLVQVVRYCTGLHKADRTVAELARIRHVNNNRVSLLEHDFSWGDLYKICKSISQPKILHLCTRKQSSPWYLCWSDAVPWDASV